MNEVYESENPAPAEVRGSREDTFGNRSHYTAAGTTGQGMRDGDAIVASLGGKRVGSKGWIFRCPVHDDKKPSAFMSRNGVLHCHAGCSRADMAAALDAAGFRCTAARQPVNPASVRNAREAEIRRAQSLWKDAEPNSHHDTDTVAYYLKSRGITLPVPVVIRRWKVNGIISALHQRDGTLTAVQTRTATGRRNTYGWLGSGAVQLAPPLNGELGLAEGVESALAATELTGIPCWAVLGAERLDQIFIPPDVRRVHLFADNDAAGQFALQKATKRYKRWFAVRQCTPVGVKDYNDLLLQAEGEV